jgi:hypothetical protein
MMAPEIVLVRELSLPVVPLTIVGEASCAAVRTSPSLNWND